MLHSTVSFAGLELEAYLVDDISYITLTSLAAGLGVHRQSLKNWVQNHCTVDGIAVQAGRNKVPATAYPIKAVIKFLTYRMKAGDIQAEALLEAVACADLDRTIREACGIQVTAAQHEQVRSAERERILKSYIEAKLGIISEDTERQEAMSQQLTPDEYQEYCWVSNKVNIEMYEWQLANFHHDDQEARDNQQQQVFDATYSRIKVGELAQIQAECNQYWSR